MIKIHFTSGHLRNMSMRIHDEHAERQGG